LWSQEKKKREKAQGVINDSVKEREGVTREGGRVRREKGDCYKKIYKSEIKGKRDT